MTRGLFALLCISVWINYIDRGNLSVAAPVLRPDMDLTPAQMGVLLSGFFWTYSLFQPIAGWLVDRGNVYRLYAAAFAIWSLAVALGGLAPGFVTLLLSRLALGIGESLAYPAYSRMLASAFPEERRGIANAMIDVGTKAGPALGTFLGALAIGRWGWRPFFFAMGILSLLWLIPWIRAIPAVETREASGRRAHVTRQLLRRREAWVTFVGLFCFNYAFYFLLTWLPSWLVQERRFVSFRQGCVTAGMRRS
jgi:MFS transporter, ACS family, D-galactonate transporter